MRKMIAVLVIIAMAVISMAGAQNLIQGEAKGPDDPGAMIVGIDNQTINLSGAVSMDLVNQATGVRGVDLSGTDPAVFDQPWLKKDNWVNDGGSYGMTPSQRAFINDKSGGELRYSPEQRDWLRRGPEDKA